MNLKTKISITLLFVAFCTWFYFTPHLAVSEMKSAAKTRDAAKLSSYVNFPALKVSLKNSFNSKLALDVMKENDGNPFASGTALAALFINPMIDALITPESLANLMRGDNPQRAPKTEQAKSPNSDTVTSMSYESFDRFVVTVKKVDTTEEPISLVFDRSGMFSWKLSALRLPL